MVKNMLSQTLIEQMKMEPCASYCQGYSQPGGCTEDEYFICEGCQRKMPYCLGAADDMPDHCDDCWGLAHRDEK